MHHIVFVNGDKLGASQWWVCAREPDGNVWLFIRRDRVNLVPLLEILQALSARPAIA